MLGKRSPLHSSSRLRACQLAQSTHFFPCTRRPSDSLILISSSRSWGRYLPARSVLGQIPGSTSLLLSLSFILQASGLVVVAVIPSLFILRSLPLELLAGAALFGSVSRSCSRCFRASLSPLPAPNKGERHRGDSHRDGSRYRSWCNRVWNNRRYR